MRVCDIDSNGLIHLLNQEAAGESKDDHYEKAVLNILNAQKFSCIPLTNKPRIRNHTNNLVDRAAYESGQGIVTHIARKGIYEDEDDLVIIDVNEIPLVSDEDDVMIGIEKLFTRENGSERCHLCLLVGESKEEPTALLTIYELNSNAVRNEILKRLAIASLEEDDSELLKMGVGLHDSIGALVDKNDLNVKTFQNTLDNITTSISRVHYDENPQQTTRLTNLYNNDISDLRVKDVMTVGSAGIYWDGHPSSKLAAKILSLGNDFTNLVIYNESGGLKSEIITIESPKNTKISNIKMKERTAKKIDSEESIIEVYKIFKKNSSNNFLIIPPNKNLIFGEGSMKWPGLITDENILSSRLALLHIGTMCVNIEILFTKVAERFKIKTVGIKRGEGTVKKSISECSLGEIIHKLRKEGLMKEIPNINKKDITNTKDLRNKIFHVALSTMPMKEKKRTLEIKHVCSANRVLLALQDFI